MNLNQYIYHFYLIIYGGKALTEKFENGILYDHEDYEKTIISINKEYSHLQKDLHQNPNRYMIVNYNTGLYLGAENLLEMKKKFPDAIVITKIDVSYFYFDFEKESQFVYKYLVSQWLRLNSLV